METVNLSQMEFSLLDTSVVNLFPDPGSLIKKTMDNKGRALHSGFIFSPR